MFDFPAIRPSSLGVVFWVPLSANKRDKRWELIHTLNGHVWREKKVPRRPGLNNQSWKILVIMCDQCPIVKEKQWQWLLFGHVSHFLLVSKLRKLLTSHHLLLISHHRLWVVLSLSRDSEEKVPEAFCGPCDCKNPNCYTVCCENCPYARNKP